MDRDGVSPPGTLAGRAGRELPAPWFRGRPDSDDRGGDPHDVTDNRNRSQSCPPSPPWASLGRSRRCARRAWHHRGLPIQALTIPDALAGRDVCGKAKTGSGKTFAFGPVLARQKASPATPRRSRSCPPVSWPSRSATAGPDRREAGLTVVAVYGGADMDRQIQAFRPAPTSWWPPGPMIDLLERKEVSVADVDHVIVDEADRMADMGFLPQVEWILRNVEGTPPDAAVLGHPRRRGRHADQALPARPRCSTRWCPAVTVGQMEHRFFAVHQMDPR